MRVIFCSLISAASLAIFAALAGTSAAEVLECKT